MQKSRFRRILLIVGIVLIALNLRPALAGIGPLVAAIRQDTGISNTMIGLLTTLPLLAFGIISALTPLVTRRIGVERTLAAALLLLTGGILLRLAPSVLMLFVGTALLSIAIAFGNVLLPSLVKRDFPERTGIMTSLYSSVMGLGATIGAGISVPLAEQLSDAGWRGSLGAWALPAVCAFIVWIPQLSNRTLPGHSRGIGASLEHLGRSRLAWYVALFMGMQSLTFYVFLAWLPEILQSRGLTAGYAGWMLALSQATGILGTLIVPTWAERLTHQRHIIWMLMLLESIALLGFLSDGTALVAVWSALIGFVLGSSFGLALLFIVLRTGDTQTATELSGMAQSVGYLLAATGPTIFGYLQDATRSWTMPLLFLFVILIAKLVVGLGAGQPNQIRR